MLLLQLLQLLCELLLLLFVPLLLLLLLLQLLCLLLLQPLQLLCLLLVGLLFAPDRLVKFAGALAAFLEVHSSP